ncbi:MAG TPA: hypothetical protein VGF12_16100 [Roseateles sp.]|uniref:hypothetical protein n=1 Tax=Roseateles sp. TaxID=1971397 RepID=UPI002EDA74E7
MKEGLLIAQLVLFAATLGMLAWVALHQRRTKKHQDALLSELQASLGQQRWFRINLARPAFFDRRLRVLAFEAKGLLIDEGDRLRILAARPDGERLERTVPKQPASIRWQGNAGLRSANLHWLEIGTGAEAVMISADTGMNALASREATADMLRALLPQQPLDAAALADFALDKHPATRLAMATLLVLLLALVGDIAVSEHQALAAAWPLGLLGFGVGLAALLLYPVFIRRKVPGRESLILTVLLGAVLGGVAPRAALRLDQWLSGGPVPTSYRLVQGATLKPVEPGPPDVRLNNVREYWAQFDVGSTHQLDIVHGPLGLWQLDRSRLNGITRDWYLREDRPADRGASAPSR